MIYDNKMIFAFAKKFINLKFGSVMTALAVTYELTVNKDIESARNAEKRENEITVIFISHESFVINADRTVNGNLGRIRLKLIA